MRAMNGRQGWVFSSVSGRGLAEEEEEIVVISKTVSEKDRVELRSRD